MRIKSIEFENFRNFREHGLITCSTDGKITVIYGKNGDGKTTLHQLFQWIIYGKVHFNKTTTDHLYNLAFESEQEYGSVFEVMGRIDFEDRGEQYSLTRKYTYRKGIDDSEKIGEDYSLLKMDDDYNWRRVERPQETVEKLLPSGLSEYFFFDGESMIADLRVKGKDSAAKLRKALYSMFDLDVIESALTHVGRTDSKTTVLGKLYMNKGSIASGSEISAVKTNIENAQGKIAFFEEEKEKNENKKAELKELIQNISEEIGGAKSKADYEKIRKEYQSQRDAFLDNVKSETKNFGDDVMASFPAILVSKAIIDAEKKLNLKVKQKSSALPDGLSKRLIAYLTRMNTDTCICGRELCEEQKQHINAFLGMMPPMSYTSMYQNFTQKAESMRKNYDKESLEERILRVLKNQENAEACDKKIMVLDDAEKKSKDIEDLIVARQKAEESVKELEGLISKQSTEIEKHNIYLKQQMKKFDELTKGNEEGILANQKIEIMEAVADFFRNKLDQAAKEYSKELEGNIQLLLNDMLTSKRTVHVTDEFSVRVTDSFNDESKSEGQFAVVSFAYIGGILQMLKREGDLNAKEYPLVLDGPFSKLDSDQKQNVVDKLPEFAPQVIVFSKDDLHDVIKTENIGKVWTIMSNDEKNVATIEEGKLWK